MVTQADMTSGMETSPSIGSATRVVKTAPIKVIERPREVNIPSQEDEVRNSVPPRYWRTLFLF
jgi:hypothetical protein